MYLCLFLALFLLDSGKALWLWMGWWPRADHEQDSDGNNGTYIDISSRLKPK